MSNSMSEKNKNNETEGHNTNKNSGYLESYSLYGNQLNRTESTPLIPARRSSFGKSATISRPAISTINLCKESPKGVVPNSALRFVPIKLNLQNKIKPVASKEASLTSSQVDKIKEASSSEGSNPDSGSFVHIPTTLKDFKKCNKAMGLSGDIYHESHDQPRTQVAKQQRFRNGLGHATDGRRSKDRIFRDNSLYVDEDEFDWNEFYDPRRPNNYKAFIQSDERWEEDNDWRQFLVKTKLEILKNPKRENNDIVIEDTADHIVNTTDHIEDLPLTSEQENFTSMREFMELGKYDEQEDLLVNSSTRSILKSSFAQRTLEKYGWKPGQGLGVHNEGIKKPIRLKTTLSDFTKSTTKPDAGTIFFKLSSELSDGNLTDSKQSRVVKIKWLANVPDQLVSVDYCEELPSLIGPILEQQFGPVERIAILAPDLNGQDLLRLIVKFSDDRSAMRVLAELKSLLGHDVVITLYDEDLFEAGVLE